jgi:poly-gamma-glutamate synthesis protein (capsule biosynthesis protein)
VAQLALAALAAATLCSCQTTPTAAADPVGIVSSATAPAAAPSRAATTRAAPSATGSASAADRVTVLFGGDVSFGRSVGQRVLREPDFDPFAAIAPWLGAAALRVVNLESVLGEHDGLTEHPHNDLVFSGPPASADALKRAGIDVVSLANNHSWDYGKQGLTESLGLLERVGIQAVGASVPAGGQYDPVVIERQGVRIALLAFTQVWNDGTLEEHTARHVVAGPDYEAMKRAIRRARKRSDFVVASLHASNEYVPLPRERARRFARALLVSGADLVFGHHPHVLQGVEWIGDKPILYSLGNLVFDSRQDRPETRAGAVALVGLERRDERVVVGRLELCPLALEDALPVPAPVEPLAAELPRLSQQLGGLYTAPGSTDGCLAVHPSATPLPYAERRGFDPPDRQGAAVRPRAARVPLAKLP